jgi:hypothetical protein
MGLSSTSERKETAMAEPWLSTGEKVTEFFATDQMEASARRTKFVQRASKITGKLFLALITFGRWRVPQTTVPQLAAKAAQLDIPVDITPEALQQRRTARAVAFLQDLLQTAFAKLHTGATLCEEGIFASMSPGAGRSSVTKEGTSVYCRAENGRQRNGDREEKQREEV